MQSPNKETDPHIFAIETLLAAHAEKAPPLVHDPAAPVAPQVHIAPPISVGASAPHVEPALSSTDARDVDVQNARPSEIKVDGLQPPAAQPMRRGMKRVVMAILALLGATAAAGWQQYGDQAKAMALEWTPTPVLAAIYSATKPAAAAQPSASTTEAAVSDQAAAPQPVAATPSDQPVPAVIAATPPTAESSQLQAMTQDLAAMGRQVEELKATIAQLKANQAQLTRDLTRSSEPKVGEAKPLESNPRAKMSALTPPPQRPVAPPVRKPKPMASSYAPAYTAAPAPAAPLPAVQAAAPPPPAPPAQTIADDGQPVVRPPMPLR
jgi:hypothetical protein